MILNPEKVPYSMLRLAFIHIFGHGHGKIKIGFTGILNSGLAGDNTTYKKKENYYSKSSIWLR